MVVRGGGAGAGLGAFAVPATGCAGAAVIGPEGACARATAASRSVSAANPVKTAGLKYQLAFMFGLKYSNNGKPVTSLIPAE